MTELAGRMNHSTKLRAATLGLLGIPLSLELMEARTASELPEGPGLAV